METIFLDHGDKQFWTFSREDNRQERSPDTPLAEAPPHPASERVLAGQNYLLSRSVATSLRRSVVFNQAVPEGERHTHGNG